MSESEIRAAIEAILLASAEPVSLAELTNAIGEADLSAVDAQISEIERRAEEHFGGLRLERVSGGFRFATRPEYDPYLRKFFEKRRENRLSIASLETLAIVAYRQPITGPEISELRGVNSSGVLRTLLDKKLVRIAGRKNVVGSPFLYRTTSDFLMHFGLEKIQDLPDLEEFGQLVGEMVEGELLLSGLNTSDEISEVPFEDDSEEPSADEMFDEDEIAESTEDGARGEEDSEPEESAASVVAGDGEKDG